MGDDSHHKYTLSIFQKRHCLLDKHAFAVLGVVLESAWVQTGAITGALLSAGARSGLPYIQVWVTIASLFFLIVGMLVFIAGFLNQKHRHPLSSFRHMLAGFLILLIPIIVEANSCCAPVRFD